MMGPLSLGPGSKHVKASRGPDINKAQFYVTEYSTNHGRENFLPRVGKHTGTGYLSNFRPGIYYSRKIDELDNPAVGKLLEGNYKSSHQTHFQHYIGANGKDNLSEQYQMRKTGFIRDIPRTLPSYQKTRTACYNPVSKHNAKVPRPPLYHVLNPNDPISKENDYHGPAFMSTENKTRFVGKISQQMDTSTKKVGYKGESGFSHTNYEPITYRPPENFQGLLPGWYTHRPTGHSVMMQSFQPINHGDGNDSFKVLAKRAERDTGYTREIAARPRYTNSPTETYTKLDDLHPVRRETLKKKDPAEYLNMQCANRFPSMTSSTFQGIQRNYTQEMDSTQNAPMIGKKENTGFTENNKYTKSMKTPPSFNTHYKLRFSDKNPKTLEREYNAMNQLSNGFTKSTQVHQQVLINDIKMAVTQLHPYVAKSIISRDPYYISHENGCRT